MNPQNWSFIRSQYPAACQCVFLNTGSRGLLSYQSHQAGVEALNRDLAMQSDGGLSEQERNQARQLFASLIGARSQEIALTKNVSEGLNAVAASIDWREGDNVVVCSELEHANNIYLWHHLRRRGVEVRDVSPKQGSIDPAAMAAVSDKRTRLITVSSVTFIPGFRTDLEAVSAVARRHGALFLVDAVQSCGVLEIDVKKDGIDALATSTSKGLLGLRGLGFLYVSEAWCNRLTPSYVARNSFNIGEGHYSDFEGSHINLQPNAQRFECGNYNYTGIAVANAAMASILNLGVKAIEARATKLALTLANGLGEQGWPVNKPAAPRKPSHLVTLGKAGSGSIYHPSDLSLQGLADALQAADIRFAIRRGVMRFGFHFYNNEDDVDSVLSVAARTRRASISI